MPNGFVGNPAKSYLGDVENALLTAKPIHSRDPFQNLSNRAVPPPALPVRLNRQVPYPQDTARQGSHFTGVGNSTNIVVGDYEYQAILRQIEQVDDNLGEQLYNIASEIELLCETSYILPRAVPKCLAITMGIKGSMGNFRSLTTESIIKMQGFVGSMLGLG